MRLQGVVTHKMIRRALPSISRTFLSVSTQGLITTNLFKPHLRRSMASWIIDIKGKVPKKVPYASGRGGRPYVAKDTKAWRKKIARAFIKLGGRAPMLDEVPTLYVDYYLEKKHADMDSLYHSIQDALTKDALKINDNRYNFAGHLCGIVGGPKQERVVIEVEYAEA